MTIFLPLPSVDPPNRPGAAICLRTVAASAPGASLKLTNGPAAWTEASSSPFSTFETSSCAIFAGASFPSRPRGFASLKQGSATSPCVGFLGASSAESTTSGEIPSALPTFFAISDLSCSTPASARGTLLKDHTLGGNTQDRNG